MTTVLTVSMTGDQLGIGSSPCCGCADANGAVIDDRTCHFLYGVVPLFLISKAHKPKSFGSASQRIGDDLQNLPCVIPHSCIHDNCNSIFQREKWLLKVSSLEALGGSAGQPEHV